MNQIFKIAIGYIKRQWFKEHFVANKVAAKTIRRFIAGTCNTYEWDDLESVNHENLEVDIAIRLCCFFARKYPGKKTEFCGREADKYFLAIADALEQGYLSVEDYLAVKKDLDSNILPKSLRYIFDDTGDIPAY